jgi:S-DNA-T family DNA segregation ATPase FtsK/SpoIIIE
LSRRRKKRVACWNCCATRSTAASRALGIQFVLATQSLRAEIINGNLKAVLNTRITFRTASRADSRVILDRADAAVTA